MRNKTPHLIILSSLFAVAHYTQVGAEMVAHAFPEQTPMLGSVSSTAVAASMWLLIVLIVPWVCRSILWIYGLAGRATDMSYAWGRAKLVEAMKLLLDRLNQ
jgi:hypothetical protein